MDLFFYIKLMAHQGTLRGTGNRLALQISWPFTLGNTHFNATIEAIPHLQTKRYKMLIKTPRRETTLKKIQSSSFKLRFWILKLRYFTFAIMLIFLSNVYTRMTSDGCMFLERGPKQTIFNLNCLKVSLHKVIPLLFQLLGDCMNTDKIKLNWIVSGHLLSVFV